MNTSLGKLIYEIVVGVATLALILVVAGLIFRDRIFHDVDKDPPTPPVVEASCAQLLAIARKSTDSLVVAIERGDCAAAATPAPAKGHK